MNSECDAGKMISMRIDTARVILISGLVLLHVPPHVPLTEVPALPFDLIKAFFAQGVLRTMTYCLTIIAGYLCFLRGPNLSFYDQLWSKGRSLLVPLIIWNVPLVFALFLAQRYGYFTNLGADDAQASGDWWTFLNLSFGLTAAPINVPFNFIRDLLVTQLLAPIFAIFLKRAPYIGLVVVAIVFLPNLDGPLVLRNQLPIIFYLGGMIAVLKYDPLALDRYRAVALGILILWCAILVAMRSENRALLSIAAPFLLWPLLSYFDGTALSQWASKHRGTTFMVFAMHLPILSLEWFAFTALGLDDRHALYPLFWVVAPVVAISLSAFAHTLLGRYWPRAARAVVGSR